MVKVQAVMVLLQRLLTMVEQKPMVLILVLMDQMAPVMNQMSTVQTALAKTAMV